VANSNHARHRSLWRDIGGHHADLDLDSVEELAHLLDRVKAPAPSEAETSSLIDKLAPLLEEEPVAKPSFRVRLEQERQVTRGGWWLRQLIGPQLSLLGTPFMILSAVFMVLGFLLTPILLPLDVWAPAVVAPLLAGWGTLFAFRSAHYRVREMELSAPISPVQLALSRLLLVLVTDTIVAAMASGLFVVWRLPLSPWLVIFSWFVPLVFAGSIALALSFYMEMPQAALLLLLLWALQIAGRSVLPMFSLVVPPAGGLTPALFGAGVLSLLLLAGVAVRLRDEVA